MTEKSKKLGERGEDAAVAYLVRSGMEIVERNWRCKHGEVDIVALDGESLVLCEVKTRRSTSKGSPEEAISEAKQRKYGKLAAAYLQSTGLKDVDVRFDAITILVIAEDRALLRHFKSAFVAEVG